MPRYLPNIHISDCWSSIGNISFFHIDGRCYWRTRPRPVFPGTPSQQHQAEIHHRALMAWRTLSSDEQHQWNENAKTVPSHRPPYDHNHHITGHNLFVSAYHGFAQMGNEHLPQPAVYPRFPETKITSVSGRIVGSSNLKIDCRILLLDCTDPHRFRFAARIQLTRPGGGLNQSLMRSFMGNTVAWTQVQGGYGILVSFLVPENKNIWNLNWHESTFHLYGQLIDTQTGYRGNKIRGKLFMSIR